VPPKIQETFRLGQASGRPRRASPPPPLPTALKTGVVDSRAGRKGRENNPWPFAMIPRQSNHRLDCSFALLTVLTLLPLNLIKMVNDVDLIALRTSGVYEIYFTYILSCEQIRQRIYHYTDFQVLQGNVVTVRTWAVGTHSTNHSVTFIRWHVFGLWIYVSKNNAYHGLQACLSYQGELQKSLQAVRENRNVINNLQIKTDTQRKQPSRSSLLQNKIGCNGVSFPFNRLPKNTVYIQQWGAISFVSEDRVICHVSRASSIFCVYVEQILLKPV
jgi:hypothetical protein